MTTNLVQCQSTRYANGVSIRLPKMPLLSINRMLCYAARFNLAQYGIDCRQLLAGIEVFPEYGELNLRIVGELPRRELEKFPTLYNAFCAMLAEQYNIEVMGA